MYIYSHSMHVYDPSRVGALEYGAIRHIVTQRWMTGYCSEQSTPDPSVSTLPSSLIT